VRGLVQRTVTARFARVRCLRSSVRPMASNAAPSVRGPIFGFMVTNISGVYVRDLFARGKNGTASGRCLEIKHIQCQLLKNLIEAT
jgi:hypothetical protein